MTTEWEQSLGDLADYDRARGDARLLRDLRVAEGDGLVEAERVMREAHALVVGGFYGDAIAVLEAGISGDR